MSHRGHRPALLVKFHFLKFACVPSKDCAKSPEVTQCVLLSQRLRLPHHPYKEGLVTGLVNISFPASLKTGEQGKKEIMRPLGVGGGGGEGGG